MVRSPFCLTRVVVCAAADADVAASRAFLAQGLLLLFLSLALGFAAADENGFLLIRKEVCFKVHNDVFSICQCLPCVFLHLF